MSNNIASIYVSVIKPQLDKLTEDRNKQSSYSSKDKKKDKK